MEMATSPTSATLWRRCQRLRGGQGSGVEGEGGGGGGGGGGGPESDQAVSNGGEDQRETRGENDIEVKTPEDQLRDAVKECNYTLVSSLIEAGANVNHAERGTHSTALIIASFQNDVEMIQLLLSRGAKPNVCDEMSFAPLHYAGAWGYERVIDILMSNGADPTIENMEGLTARKLAENRGHINAVEVLDKWLEAG